MFYPDEVIEEVRSRNDIVDVISGYVKLQKKGNNYFGLCPFHNEKSPSFSVSQDRQMYHCFGCGAGGNVFSFLMEYEKFTFPESVKYLAERAGVELPEMEESAEARKKAGLRQTLLEVNKKVALYYFKILRSEQGELGRRYFDKRALSWDTVKAFGLGYSGQYKDDLYQYLKSEGYNDEVLKKTGLFNYSDRGEVYNKFFNRVMFPIFDVRGQVIGFGGRVMGEGEPKYLNSPETEVFDKGRNLFGLNFARNSRKSHLIICEGYMDVIALHQAGFHQAVASLGTALTTGHASLLKRYTTDVYLCYDSDGAGVKAALRAIPLLKAAGLHVKVINMRPYKDPDEFIKNLGEEEFQKRIDEAITSFQYEVGILESRYDLNEPESQTEFYKELAKRLSEFNEPLERDTYIKAICKKYSIDYNYFRTMVNDLGEKLYVTRMQEEEKLQEEIRTSGTGLRKKDTGIRIAQRILLTWLIESPESFEKIRSYITPVDFSDDLYRDVCEKLYAQLERGVVQPASIISLYETEEEHKEVAALFSEELSSEMKKKDKERAITEAIIQVKNHSVEERSRSAESIVQLQELAKEKKMLTQLMETLN